MERRHDLDALRAIAMLLGIVLHVGLAFTPFPWPVQDSQQTTGIYHVFSFIHGFRMPLFFMISGFFTAMLWRKRGLTALIKHRFSRIFLPLLLCMFTIVPLMFFVSDFVSRDSGSKVAGSIAAAWTAVLQNDEPALIDQLKSSDFHINEYADGNSTLIAGAAFMGHDDLVEILIEYEADVDKRNADGSSPLHAAAFLGRWESVKLLIDAGADVNARKGPSELPIDAAQADWNITKMICNMLGMTVDKEEVMAGRQKAISLLVAAGSPDTRPESAKTQTETISEPSDEGSELVALLTYFPVFHHLWFLWFLCLLLTGFAGFALAASWLNFKKLPDWLICSPLNLVWLVPLTMLPQAFMDPSVFGPDTSIGLIPIPAILLYYAVFFFFGSLYWDAHDRRGRLGNWWIAYLLIAAVLIYPISMFLQFKPETFASETAWFWAFNFLQAFFAWLMIFGSIGAFRWLFPQESKSLRYVSDSSYWLYIAHLPLVFILQWWMKDWAIPVWPKFLLACLITTLILLASYQLFVRNTWIGVLLNGKRGGTAKQPIETTVAEKVDSLRVG